MDQLTLVKLINNAALLLSLSLFNHLGHLMFEKRGRFAEIVDGLLIGTICIVVMSVPMTFTNGLVFDTRSILLSLSALVFGAIPTILAASMAIAFRLSMGGVGSLPGVLVILSVSAFGLFWRHFIFPKTQKHKVIYLYLFGFITHLIMLLCMLALPKELAWYTIESLSFEIMTIYPIATLMLGLLLLSQNERQEMQIRVMEADLQYRNLFENNHAVMLILDPVSGKIIDANPAAEQFYGWNREQLSEMNISEINTLSLEEIKVEMERSITFKHNHFEFRHRRADGSIADVEVYSGPIHKSGNRLLYSIIHDVTLRKTAQRELEASENRFRTLVDNAPYAIFIQSDGNFAYLNQTACHLFRIDSQERLIGSPVLDRIHPDFHQDVRDRIDALNEKIEMVPPVDEVFTDVFGNAFDVNVLAVPFEYEGKHGALVFALDISKLKSFDRLMQELEVQLRQQQKLEAIGTLAGGVAHEINNPLNGIMNYAQLIYDQIQRDSDASEYAKEIIRETDRISDIVKSLLQFSRMEKQSHSYASMYDVVSRTTSLIKTIIKKDNIDLDIQLDENLPDFKCRSQQIQQVLMNLLTNARDALNERFPGVDPMKRIEVRCSLEVMDHRRWLMLSVKDYGCGIPEENLNRIFEPFYSTKPKDKGTGLGLSISYGIVKDHHGEIYVDSKVGETCFTVKLPVDNGWEHPGEVA